MPRAPYATLAPAPVEVLTAETSLGTFRFKTLGGLGDLEFEDKAAEFIRDYIRPGDDKGPRLITVPSNPPVVTTPTVSKLRHAALLLTRDVSDLEEGEVTYGFLEWLLVIENDGPDWAAIKAALVKCEEIERARKDPKPRKPSIDGGSSLPPGVELPTTS